MPSINTTKVAIKVKDKEGCFILNDVEGDGNCFFRALCQHSFFSNFDHYHLREDLAIKARNVLDNGGEMMELMQILYDQTVFMNNASRKCIADYIGENLGKDRQYVGDFETLLISLFYPVKLYVVTASTIGTSENATDCFATSVDVDVFADVVLAGSLSECQKNLLVSENQGTVAIHILCHFHRHPLMKENMDKNHYLWLEPSTEKEASDRGYVIMCRPCEEPPKRHSGPVRENDTGEGVGPRRSTSRITNVKTRKKRKAPAQVQKRVRTRHQKGNTRKQTSTRLSSTGNILSFLDVSSSMNSLKVTKKKEQQMLIHGARVLNKQERNKLCMKYLASTGGEYKNVESFLASPDSNPLSMQHANTFRKWIAKFKQLNPCYPGSKRRSPYETEAENLDVVKSHTLGEKMNGAGGLNLDVVKSHTLREKMNAGGLNLDVVNTEMVDSERLNLDPGLNLDAVNIEMVNSERLNLDPGLNLDVVNKDIVNMFSVHREMVHTTKDKNITGNKERALVASVNGVDHRVIISLNNEDDFQGKALVPNITVVDRGVCSEDECEGPIEVIDESSLTSFTNESNSSNNVNLTSPIFLFCENCMRCSYVDEDEVSYPASEADCDIETIDSLDDDESSCHSDCAVIGWKDTVYCPTTGNENNDSSCNPNLVVLPEYDLSIEKIAKRPNFHWSRQYCHLRYNENQDVERYDDYMLLCKTCRVYITGRNSDDDLFPTRRRRSTNKSVETAWKKQNEEYLRWRDRNQKSINLATNRRKYYWPAYLWLLLTDDTMLRIGAHRLWTMLPCLFRCYWFESLLRRKGWIYRCVLKHGDLNRLRIERRKRVSRCCSFFQRATNEAGDELFDAECTFLPHCFEMKASGCQAFIEKGIKQISSTINAHRSGIDDDVIRYAPWELVKNCIDFKKEDMVRNDQVTASERERVRERERLYHCSSRENCLLCGEFSTVEMLEEIIADPYDGCSYECPKSSFHCGSEMYLDSCTSKMKNDSHSLLHFLNQYATVCSVRCPYGCSEFIFDIKLVEYEAILERYTNPYIFGSSIARLNRKSTDRCLIGGREDFLDHDDATFLPFKVEDANIESIQSLKRIFVMTLEGPAIATCKRHGNGNNLRYIHPPMNPVSFTLTSSVSPQLAPCVLRPNVVKSMRRNRFSTTYEVRLMSGCYKGINSTDVSNIGKMDLSAPIHDANMLLALHHRKDIRLLMSNMVKRGYIPKYFEEACYGAAYDKFECTGNQCGRDIPNYLSCSLNDALRGSTFISFEDSINLDKMMSTCQPAKRSVVMDIPFQSNNNDGYDNTDGEDYVILNKDEFIPSWPMSYIFVHPFDNYGAMPNTKVSGVVNDHILESFFLCVANVAEVYQSIFYSTWNEKYFHGWVLKYVKEKFLCHVKQARASRKAPYQSWSRLSKYLYLPGRTTSIEQDLLILLRPGRTIETIPPDNSGVDPAEDDELVGNFFSRVLRSCAAKTDQVSCIFVTPGLSESIFETLPDACEILVLHRRRTGSSRDRDAFTDNDPIWGVKSSIRHKNGSFKARFISITSQQSHQTYSYIRHREDEFKEWWCVEATSSSKEKKKPYHARYRLYDKGYSDCHSDSNEHDDEGTLGFLPSEVLELWEVIVYVRTSRDIAQMKKEAFGEMGGHSNVICKQHKLPLIECRYKSPAVCTADSECKRPRRYECVWGCDVGICSKHLSDCFKKHGKDSCIVVPSASEMSEEDHDPSSDSLYGTDSDTVVLAQPRIHKGSDDGLDEEQSHLSTELSECIVEHDNGFGKERDDVRSTCSGYSSDNSIISIDGPMCKPFTTEIEDDVLLSDSSIESSSMVSNSLGRVDLSQEIMYGESMSSSDEGSVWKVMRHSRLSAQENNNNSGDEGSVGGRSIYTDSPDLNYDSDYLENISVTCNTHTCTTDRVGKVGTADTCNTRTTDRVEKVGMVDTQQLPFTRFHDDSEDYEKDEHFSNQLPDNSDHPPPKGGLMNKTDDCPFIDEIECRERMDIQYSSSCCSISSSSQKNAHNLSDRRVEQIVSQTRRRIKGCTRTTQPKFKRFISGQYCSFIRKFEENGNIIQTNVPLQIPNGLDLTNVFRTNASQAVPSHNSNLQINDDVPFNCHRVPTARSSFQRPCEIHRLGAKYMGAHTFVNMKGQCLLRRNNEMSLTQHERGIVQDMITSSSGDGCCISYGEAALFPDMFWYSNTDGSCVGSLTSILWTDSERASKANIAGFHDHLITRATNPLLPFAGNTRYLYLGLDVLSNIELRGVSDKNVLSRGLREPCHGLKILNSGTTIRNVRSCDVIDSRHSVNCLACMLRKQFPGYFVTVTCNAREFPGMNKLYNVKSAFHRTVDEDPQLSSECRHELKQALERVAAVQSTRTWQVCIESVITYLTYSSDEILGKFDMYFGRLENQENELKASGTNSHLHLIAWTSYDRSNPEEVDKHYRRIRCSSKSFFFDEDIKKLIEMGIISDIKEAEEIKEKTRVLQVHDCVKCGHRCMIQVSEGVWRCRYVDYAAENPRKIYGTILIDMKHSDKATAILVELGFMREKEDKTIEITDDRFQAVKHVYPAEVGEKFTPTNPTLFSLVKSDCNVIVCGRYMVTRYLANYVGCVDEVARVHYSCKPGTNGDLQITIERLGNTKIKSQKIAAENKLRTKKLRCKPHGRIIGLPEAISQILSFKTVFCSEKFVCVSTVSLEQRPAVFTKRPNDDVSADTARRNRSAPVEPISGSGHIYTGPPSIEKRKGFEKCLKWRQFSREQQLQINDNFSLNISVDSVTMFSCRPPELFFIGNYVDYLIYFAPSGKEKIIQLTEDIRTSPWLDGFQKRMYVRRPALEEIAAKYSDKMLSFHNLSESENGYLDTFLLFHSLLYIANGHSFSTSHNTSLENIGKGNTSTRRKIHSYSQQVILNRFVDSTYDHHSVPLPIYSSVKPTNATKFYVHVLLSMGTFDTEYELWDATDVRDCFITAGLLTESAIENEDEAMKQLHDVAKRFVSEQLLYLPTGTRAFDFYVQEGFKTLKSIYMAGSVPAYPIPSSLHSFLERQMKGKVKKLCDDLRRSMAAALVKEVGGLPSEAELLSATIPNPVNDDLIVYTSRSDQSSQSCMEQREAFKAVKATIDKFCSGQVSDNNNWILHGAPGTGKTHLALLLAAYAMGRGLTVLSTAKVCERALVLGGIHYHALTKMGHTNSLNQFHAIASQCIDKIKKFYPEHLFLLRSLDILVFDEFGQTAAEELHILDMILRWARQNEAYLGGVVMIAAMDMEQLGAILGKPVLLAANMITSFQIIDLQHYVRCGNDRKAQRVNEVCRMKYIHKEARKQFIKDIVENCNFVSDINDPEVPLDAMRVLGLRKGLEAAESQFVANLEENQISVCRVKAIDTEKSRASLTTIYKPAEKKTVKALNRASSIREPEVLYFYPDVVMEFTHNKNNWYSQGQLCICKDLPSRHCIENIEDPEIFVYKAPPGTRSNPPDNVKESDASLRAAGWIRISVKRRTAHNSITISSGVSARRSQFPLRGRIASTCHKSMGDSLGALVTEVSTAKNSNGYLWDRGQIVVLLSRTSYLNNLYLVTSGGRTKEEVANDLLTILDRKPQYYEYMRHLIDVRGIRFCPRDVDPLLRTTRMMDYQQSASRPRIISLTTHPFRPMDIDLPDEGIVKYGYTYFLLSLTDMRHYYIGSCNDIVRRFDEHNHDLVSAPHQIAPAHLRPWAIIAFISGFTFPGENQTREREWQFAARDTVSRNPRCQIIELLEIGKNFVRANKSYVFQECAKLEYLQDHAINYNATND